MCRADWNPCNGPSMPLPIASTLKSSPISVLEAWKAHNSVVMKRSMASQGQQPMLFGDAKKMLDEVLAALKA